MGGGECAGNIVQMHFWKGEKKYLFSSLLSSLAAENVDRMFRRLFTRGYKPDFLFSFFPLPHLVSPYSKRERERGTEVVPDRYT